MPRKKKTPPPPETPSYWDTPNPDTAWVTEFRKRYNGFDPVGFARVIDSGKLLIAPKGGAGLVPLAPKHHQAALIQRILANRRNFLPTRLIVIKPRQGVGLTTISAAIFTGDAVSNRAVTAMVSAMQPETMESIWDVYRLMFASVQNQITESGGFKDGLEKKRGARDNRRQLRLPATLSAVHIANADVKQGKNLARGLSLKHWHASEADYYRRLDNCMNSAMPAMDPSPMSIAIFETTPNMEASTYFKDFVKRNLERAANPDATHEGLWDIWFIPWFEAEYFCRPLSANSEQGPLTPAETELVKLGAKPENLAWRRYELNAQFGGNEKAFTEAYPATLKEALSTWGISDFFYTDAVDFYRERTTKVPVSRWRMDCNAKDPMVEILDDRDAKLLPHMELWRPPESGKEYIIAADCADSEGRLTTAGSHNYAVILDQATGEQVAEYEANCPVYLFSQALAQMGLYYNTALIAPESNYDGRAVVDFLNVRFNYPNLYRREVTDGMVLRDTEQYGFKTTSGTRQLLIDRLRYAFNTRRLLLRSSRLLEQIVEFGHRGGAKIETSGKERGLLDDGVIALGIACAVHDLTSKWRPWTLDQLAAEKPIEHKLQKKLENRQEIRYNISPDEFDGSSTQDARLRRELNRT